MTSSFGVFIAHGSTLLVVGGLCGVSSNMSPYRFGYLRRLLSGETGDDWNKGVVDEDI
jgi:hypothetical protein